MSKEKTSEKKAARLPNIIEALIPIVVMMGLMIYGFIGNSVYSDAHMPLLVAITAACIIGVRCGHSFADMLDGMMKRIYASLEAILILCTVGLLVSSFMMSGTIPALIFYGLDLLTPKLFLPVGCIICSVVGMACGSSWTATATVGIAFMAIGEGLGISPALTAGMVISGAYVGDKFSPLSDTTNLAAAVSGTGLFDHVSAMVSTTGPTLVIALILYTIIGLRIDPSSYDPTIATGMQQAIADTFYVSPVLLIPILVIIAACVLKLPALIGIIISIVVGVGFSVAFQGVSDIGTAFDILHYGPSVATGNEYLDAVLAKGGMDNQMWTINLVLLAVAFGGALEKCGCIEALFGGLKKHLKTVGGTVAATMVTSIFCDATMCDQFLGIGIPAPLYEDKYDELGLSRSMLSRTLEDAGTLWAVMFPWTGCGAYQMGVLGVHPFLYFPYAFVNLLNPILAAALALLKRNILWADGSYTNIFGKTKKGTPAKAPEEAHARAMEALERLRAEGKAPSPTK